MFLIHLKRFFDHTNNHDITLLHQNIAGLLNKTSIVCVALEQLKKQQKNVDVICFTETFIKEGSQSNIVLSDYKLGACFCRKNHKRGGSCILVKNYLSFKVLSVLGLAAPYVFELCGIELLNYNTYILCVYRTPTSDPTLFLEKFNILLNFLGKNVNKKIIITGDWNIDILKQNKCTAEITSILSNNGLSMHIKTPTRNYSCIDQIASNIQDAIAQVHYLALSDHETGQTLTFRVNKKCDNIYQWFEYKRDYSKENVTKFYDCMSALTFEEMYSTNKLNKAFNIFHEILLLFYNLCFPFVRVKITHKKQYNKWLSKGIKLACIKKRKLYLTYKHSAVNKKSNKHLYKKYNKILKKCIAISHKLQHKNYILNSKNKAKASWDVIKHLKGSHLQQVEIKKIIYEHKEYTEPRAIAEQFNNFFINLPKKVTNKNNNNYNSITRNSNTIYLTPTDGIEIYKIIMSLNNTTAVGSDGISTKILKTCAKSLCEPLSFLINLSFEEGNFPNKLKTSIVRPLFKKGDQYDINNYRPITMIPVISKIFEKAMFSRLYSFLTNQNILSPYQFGFRKKSSTILACFNLVKTITESLNRKSHVCGIFLDMSKAFDYMEHYTLLFKMERYGVRGVANDWLKSYLVDRRQMVQINRINKVHNNTYLKKYYNSKYHVNNCGVPQGSVLGPLLFISGINDLPTSTKEKCFMFADDTTLIIESKNKCSSLEFEEQINNNLNSVINWLDNNNLNININKTKCIQFLPYNKNPLRVNVNYRNSDIEEVDSTKFLGVIVDKNCNWKAHVEYICKKLDRFVFALKKIRLEISLEAALSAYHGYVSSVLSYGLIIWGNSQDAIKVFRIQKKSIRTMCRLGQLESCKPYFQILKILPVPCMYIKLICIFVKEHPNYFKTNAQEIGTKCRNADNLFIPQCRLSMCKKNVYFMCIQIYNKLPIEIKSLSGNVFKSTLCGWLLSKCFYSVEEYLINNNKY